MEIGSVCRTLPPTHTRVQELEAGQAPKVPQTYAQPRQWRKKAPCAAKQTAALAVQSVTWLD